MWGSRERISFGQLISQLRRLLAIKKQISTRDAFNNTHLYNFTWFKSRGGVAMLDCSSRDLWKPATGFFYPPQVSFGPQTCILEVQEGCTCSSHHLLINCIQMQRRKVSI